MLKGTVYKIYPGLYSELQVFTKAQETTEKMIKTIENNFNQNYNQLQQMN